MIQFTHNPILILRNKEQLAMSGHRLVDLYLPRYGAERSCVNPCKPRQIDDTCSFDQPGEFYLLTTDGPAKVLVLSPEPANHPEQIISFVAANTSRGGMDEPQTANASTDWASVDQQFMKRLFYGRLELDLRCGLCSRMTIHLLKHLGINARPFWWHGTKLPHDAHVGIEVNRDGTGNWQYFDPHFGLAAHSHMNGMDLAFAIAAASSPAHINHLFTMLVDKGDGAAAEIAPAFASLCSAIRLEDTDKRATMLRLQPELPLRIEQHLLDSMNVLDLTDGHSAFEDLFYRQPPTAIVPTLLEVLNRK